MSQRASSESQRVTERGPLSVACAAISMLVRERWGRGPRRSRAYWAGPDMLVVLLEDAYSVAEQTLVEFGREAEVVKGRRSLAVLAEPELRRIAETAANRPVRAVLAQSHVSPDLTTIVFVLEEDTIDGQVGVTLQRSADAATAARALLAESSQVRRHSAEKRADRKADRDHGPPAQD